MLSRVLSPFKSVLQGCAARPGGAAAPAAARAASSAVQGGQELDSDGSRLLAYWRGLLDDRPAGQGGLADADVRQLLATALRLRQGKAQSSLPEQLLAVFVDHYRRLGAADRVVLFRSLTAGLGVQASEVDTAAAAWQQQRQQQQRQQQQDQQQAQQQQGQAQQQVGDAPAATPAPAAPPAEPLYRAAAQLASAATPLYSQLFVPLSQQPGGIKFLVDMRADLLQAIQAQPSGAAPLRALADALRATLAEWFSVGLLQLQRISWEGSSAELLEKVAAGEAVHRLDSWRDLKGRLDPATRRVYAFFHQALPGEPLVVLHTALTRGVSRSMDELLPPAALSAAEAAAAGQGGGRPAEDAAAAAAVLPSDRTWEPQQQPSVHAAGGAGLPAGQLLPAQQAQQAPTTAVFYSISATQRGLTGVDLGNFLIKQVAHGVQAEFPSVRTLCTLSPLPGFADWLRIQLARLRQGLPAAVELLRPEEAFELEVAAAAARASGQLPAQQAGQQQGQRAAALLGWALRSDTWLRRSGVEAAIRLPLLRLAAHYLLKERRRGLALDPVANFHLRNGAAVLQLNWHADASPAGLLRSHGIMVNYLYELDRLHSNNRAYLVDGRVAAAPGVRGLLAPAAADEALA